MRERVTVTDLRTNEVASIVHNVSRDISFLAANAVGGRISYHGVPRADCTRMIVCEKLHDDGRRTRVSTWYA